MNKKEFIKKCTDFATSMRSASKDQPEGRTFIFMFQEDAELDDGTIEQTGGCAIHGEQVELTKMLCQQMEKKDDIRSLIHIAARVVAKRRALNPVMSMMHEMAQDIVDSEKDPKIRKGLQKDLDDAMKGRCKETKEEVESS